MRLNFQSRPWLRNQNTGQGLAQQGAQQVQQNRQQLNQQNPQLSQLTGAGTFAPNALVPVAGGLTLGANINQGVANQTGAPANALQQMGQAFGIDHTQLTQAERDRFNQSQAAAGQFSQTIRGITPRAGDIARGALGDAMSGPNARFNEFADRTIAQNDAAIQTARDSRSEFESFANQRTLDQITGERAALQNELNMVNSGVNPDGSMMTPAQRDAARRGLVDQVRRRSASIQSSNASQDQQILNQLDANIASMQTQAAAQSGQLAAIQSSLQQFEASTVANAQMTALMAEAQGDLQYADFLRNNPYNPVSLFAGVAALTQASRSGAGGVGSFTFT